MTKLSERERTCLSRARRWSMGRGSGGVLTYNPLNSEWTTFRAMEAKGLVKHYAYGEAAYAGFAVTDEGNKALDEHSNSS